VELNLFSPEIAEDPYPWYRELRAVGERGHVLLNGCRIRRHRLRRPDKSRERRVG